MTDADRARSEGSHSERAHFERASPAPLRWALAPLLLLVVLATVAYLPLMDAGWIWDDDSYVTRNPVLTDPEGLSAIWTPGRTPQFYPMVFSTFWIEAHLYGDDFAQRPFGFHLVNWALHLGSAILLWRLLGRLRLGPVAAWLAAALFLVHPMQVESVAWVSERKNVLALALALLSLHCWLSKDEAKEGERVGWYVASVLLFALAMLAKTMVAALAPALFAIDAWRRTPIDGKRVAAILPFFLVGVPLGLVTAWIEATHVGASGDEFALSAIDRLVLAPRSGLWYLWTWLWPQNLAFIYERWEVSAAVPLQWIPLIIASAIGAAVTVAWRRGHRGPAVLAAIFVACVFPALGFINVYPFRFSYVADHFAYVSTTALAIASGWALARVAERWPAIAGGWRGKAGAAVLLGSFALLSMAQTTAYRDEETLWRRSLEVNPRAWMPASNLAGVLLVQAGAAGRAGDTARAAALAVEAEGFARQAIDLYPSTFTAWMKLAESLRMQGKLAEALVAARESLRLEPRIPDTHWVIGRLLELQGDREGAIESYRQSVTLPEATRYDVVDVSSMITRRRDYARLLTLAGRDAAAAPAWERVLELTPDDPVIHGNIGMAYERMGEWPKARAAYQGAVARMDLSRPDQQTLVMQVLPRLVNALLMPPSGPEEAEDALTGARWLVERTGRADALGLLLLARAEKASGLSSANATYAEASQKAADPLLPEALREEIRRFAPTFASDPPPTR